MAVKRSRTEPSYLRILLGVLLVGALLYLAKPVLVPLALAVLLTFILSPIVSLFQRLGLGRVPAVLVTVILTFAVLGTAGWAVGVEISKLARDLPDQKQKIQEKIALLRNAGSEPFSRFFQMIRQIDQQSANADATHETAAQAPVDETSSKPVVVRPEEPSGFDKLVAAVAPVLEPLAMAGLVIVLVVFMLVKREDLRNRLLGVVGHGRLTGTTKLLIDAGERLSSYLLTQLLVNIGVGLVFSAGLFIIGVPYAFLWGLLTTILRFVPYIGSWISVAFPALLSFALSPGWGQPLTVLVFFAVLDLTTANVVEPLLFGHRTGVAPIALLIAAAFWTWIWGPVGLLLSTPLTVCLVVIGQHVPRLGFLGLLLSDEPALEPFESFYQRLLAQDEEEARAVVTTYAQAGGPDKIYDDVFLPALTRARLDREYCRLTAEEEAQFFESTRKILHELAAPASSPDTQPAASTPPDESAGDGSHLAPAAVVVLGCPAHHQGEELSLEMLAQSLKPDRCRLETVSTRVLPASIEQRVERDQPALVFIAVLPPGGVPQARYLCKRLRKRFAELPIVVGYWGNVRNFDRLLSRLRSAGANYVTTTLAQSRTQILAILRPGSSPSTSVAGREHQPAGSGNGRGSKEVAV